LGIQSFGFVQLTETERGEEEVLIFTEEGSEGTAEVHGSVTEAEVPEGKRDFRCRGFLLRQDIQKIRRNSISRILRFRETASDLKIKLSVLFLCIYSFIIINVILFITVKVSRIYFGLTPLMACAVKGSSGQ
ncbi:MAG TPA: hypothetical protein PK683_20515, partial [Leptospiraceae bacterium]|nr:hypothetical protein [Leptospiraceae bacterium]